jgi:hypothetical protein
MARFVRIKKSKNLRFKLISLMYLVFLVLSIVQIPSDWLKVNQHIRTYINKPEGNYEDASLDELAFRFERVYDNFIKFINFDKTTGKLKESNSFSQNDEFFIKSNSGIELYQIILDLKKWAQLLPENDQSKQLFYDLFKEDLNNGIEKEESTKWLNWRWKHIPISLSINLMEELKLRLKLLSQFEKKLDNTRNKNAFRIRNNQSKMRVGDKTELLLNGDSIEYVRITRNDVISEEYTINGDTLIFNPTFSGKYQLSIIGKNSIEKLEIDVKPKPFGNSNQEVLKVVYVGVKYQESIIGLKRGMTLISDEGCNAKLNYNKFNIEYLPEKSGWLRMRVSNQNGLFCFDSIYAKPLPKPLIRIKDLASNVLSKKRFIKNGELELIAMHPSFENNVFEIKSFKVKWVGMGGRTENINGTILNVNAEEIQKMQYLIIHSIEYKSGIEIIKKDQPIIIQII